MSNYYTVITLANGKKMDARDYGYKAWPVKWGKKKKKKTSK